jgi:hypothetical protein
MPPAPPPSAAALLYDVPETKGFVNWGEAQADHNQVKLSVPDNWEDSDAATADRMQIANALADAGAGPSLIHDVWRDVSAPWSRPVSEAECMADLQRTWGSQTPAKIAAAQSVMAKVEASYPGTARWLNETGRGNDPALIKKAAALASRRTGR